MEQYQYPGSDDTSSDSDFLDRSLSMWTRWDGDDSDPLPLDLYTAAALGDHDCVRDIVARHDTDPNRPNRFSWTPLMYASYIGKDEVISILYQNGARLEVCNQHGWTALFCATFSGHQRTVQLLVGLGADINRIEDRLGMSPLMLAAAEGHGVIISIFMVQGVDTTPENKEGHTARALAILNGHMHIAAMMDNWNTIPSTVRTEPDIGFSSSGNKIQPLGRDRIPGPSIQDGPALLAKMMSRDLAGFSGTRYQTTSKGPRTRTTTKTASSHFRNAVTFSSSSSSTESLAAAMDFASHLGGFDRPQKQFIHSQGPSIGPSGTPFDPAGHHLLDHPNSSTFDPFSNKQKPNSKGILRTDEKTFKMSCESRVKQPMVTQVGYTPSISPLSIISDSSYIQSEIAPPFSNNLPAIPPVPNFDGDPDRVARPVSNDERNGSFIGLDEEDRTMSGRGQCETGRGQCETGRGQCETGRGQCETGRGQCETHVGEIAQDLNTLLESLNLLKYLPVFEEQEVDLRVFLTLTDADLKEVGIKLMGPRRKMTNSIARWHSGARAHSDDLEQVYADRLENALQEMGEKHQEALNRNVDLETQLRQEKELRKVVEGCLVDDRKIYQRMLQLITDTASLCHTMRGLYDNLRYLQNRLIRRIEVNRLKDGISLGPDELALNLESGLRLDDQSSPPYEESTTISFHDTPGYRLHPTGVPHTPVQPIAEPERRKPQSSSIGGSLPLEDQVSEEALNMQSVATDELIVRLTRVSHQMARVVARATNSLDQLLEGRENLPGSGITSLT